MAKAIVWTKRAEKKFSKILEYLESDWDGNVARNFAVRTFNIIKLLSDNPELGFMELEEKGIRGFTLTKHNLIFYRVTDDNMLIILNIFDTRKDPITKKY